MGAVAFYESICVPNIRTSSSSPIITHVQIIKIMEKFQKVVIRVVEKARQDKLHAKPSGEGGEEEKPTDSFPLSDSKTDPLSQSCEYPDSAETASWVDTIAEHSSSVPSSPRFPTPTPNLDAWRVEIERERLERMKFAHSVVTGALILTVFVIYMFVMLIICFNSK